MSLFLRQLAKCGQDLTLQNRAIVPPVFGAVDASLDFTGDLVVKGIISTKRGTTLFDGVAVDQVITHKICIIYVEGVTAETWVLFKGRRLDILDVEDCCEHGRVLILRCNERGTGAAAQA